MSQNTALHRLGRFLAACSLLAIGSGALVEAGTDFKQTHTVLAAIAGAASVVAASLAFRRMKGLALSLGGVVVLLGFSGLRDDGTPSAWLQVGHACLTQIHLAILFVLCARTSRGWGQSVRIEDGGWPTLRQLAWIAPAVTFAQIGLGAAYRHKMTGVVPHVSWAFATAICVMMAGTYILTSDGAGKALRSTSIWLLALTGLQILLGVGAYVARVVEGATQYAQIAVPAHVSTGSAVMALSVLWSAYVFRDVVKAPEGVELAQSGQHS